MNINSSTYRISSAGSPSTVLLAEGPVPINRYRATRGCWRPPFARTISHQDPKSNLLSPLAKSSHRKPQLPRIDRGAGAPMVDPKEHWIKHASRGQPCPGLAGRGRGFTDAHCSPASYSHRFPKNMGTCALREGGPQLRKRAGSQRTREPTYFAGAGPHSRILRIGS